MKCYRRKFGEDSVNAAVAVMARKQRTFKWKALYQVSDGDAAVYCNRLEPFLVSCLLLLLLLLLRPALSRGGSFFESGD